MASKLIGLRIPNRLLSPIEAYGKEHYPKDEDYDKTATILDLISKGLGFDGTVTQDVEQTVEQLVRQQLNGNVQQIVKQQLDTYVEQVVKQKLDSTLEQAVERIVRQKLDSQPAQNVERDVKQELNSQTEPDVEQDVEQELNNELEELAAKIPDSPENAPSELPLEDTKLEGEDTTTQNIDEPVIEPKSEDLSTEPPPPSSDEPQQQELEFTEGSIATEPQPNGISTLELTPETEESQTDEQSQAEEKLEAVEPQQPESGLLNLDEAHALAQSRGYKGKKNALRMRIRDQKTGKPEKVKEDLGIEYVGNGGREKKNSRCYRDVWE